MTYHELIELYKMGKLDDDQKAKLEKDIERQDAIGEYLLDREDVTGFSELFQDEDREADTEGFSQETDKEEEKFTKMIRSVIRKMFVRMGVIVGVAVFAVVCFVIFALPQIVDLFYYDPTRKVEVIGSEEVSGMYVDSVDQLSLDLAVYTELFLPNAYRQEASAEGKGYGKYDILIPQYTSLSSNFESVAGTIDKGKLVLYNPNKLRMPYVNVFVASECNVENYIGYTEEPDYGLAGTWEQAIEKLHSLEEEQYYIAYVTLDDVMTYKEFAAWNQENNVQADWCAIAAKTGDNTQESDWPEYATQGLVGFSTRPSSFSCIILEDYPMLTYYDMLSTLDDKNKRDFSEEVMTQHMISMLRYMSKQKKFFKMFKPPMTYQQGCSEYYNYLADNVEEFGLNIYGFAVKGKKQDLLRISELDEVVYIYTEIPE